jgi:hypothetical protein
MNVSYVSLIVSLAALGWGFWNQRRAQAAEEQLRNVRSSHFRLADQVRQENESLQRELGGLKAQWRAMGHGALFHGAMSVRDAIELDPRAADVLAAFHIGGCSSCAVSPDDTLQYAAEGNGQPVDKLLAALNRLTSSEGVEIEAMLERRPNVEISL